MPRISFNDIATTTSNENRRINFFSLKNDNDEAIVRIMHDSTDSFEIYSTHQIQLNGRYRRVSCIRLPQEPFEKCPLCESGAPVQQRIFVHMIQYVRDDSGNIVPQGVVWERAASFARELKDKIDNYGPLSDCLFKIKRHGAAGYIQTTYSIDYFPAGMNNPNLYPKIDDMFANYSALGPVVLDKDFYEIKTFINTGEFPTTESRTANTPASSPASADSDIPFGANVATPAETLRPAPWANNTPVNPAPVDTNPFPSQPVNNTPNTNMNPAPWETPKVVARPNRYM